LNAIDFSVVVYMVFLITPDIQQCYLRPGGKCAIRNKMKEYYLFYSVTERYPNFLGLMFEVRVVSYMPEWECTFYTNPNLGRRIFNLTKTPTQRLGRMIFKSRKVNIDRSFAITKGNDNESWSVEDFVKHYLEIEYPGINLRYWIFEI
jgi:hypothetical protein